MTAFVHPEVLVSCDWVEQDRSQTDSIRIVEPDVVLVRGNAKQLMLLSEALRAASIGDTGELMGRPTCAVVPATLQNGRAVVSLGCIGNRVYTGLTDDELYAAVPGSRMADVFEQLLVIVEANRKLELYHRERAGSLALIADR